MSSSLGSACSCWHLSPLKWSQSSLTVTSLSSGTRSPCSSCVVPVPDPKSASSPRSYGSEVVRTKSWGCSLAACIGLCSRPLQGTRAGNMQLETRVRYILCPYALISPTQVRDQWVLCLALSMGSIGPPSEEAWLWKNWMSSFFRKGGKKTEMEAERWVRIFFL